MAWTICKFCGERLPYPTPQQVLKDDYNCPHCGETNDPIVTIEDIVLNLYEEIEESKNRIEKLERSSHAKD